MTRSVVERGRLTSGEGEVNPLHTLSGAPAGDELLILFGKKRGANSLQFLLLGFLDVGEG